MHGNTKSLLLCLTLGLCGLVMACHVEEPTGAVQVLGSLQQTVSGADVATVHISISAADMPTREVELSRTGSTWGGIVGGLPAGTGRTFRAEAFDSAGTKLFAGEATGVTIVAGQTTLVSITLQEVTPPPPFQNSAPCITSLVANPSSVDPGGVVSLLATAKDVDPGDSLTPSWTATSGTFSSASSFSTTWTAPATEGPVTLTLTVTDSKGAATIVSLTITVRAGRGSAAILVSLNTWPRVLDVTASPTAVEVGESTSVSATVRDNDGDGLTYAWNSTCAGTWTNGTSATATFTPTAQPSGDTCANCPLSVTVTDGRGGQTTGTLAICVGRKPTAVFPPEIVETFQSSAEVAGGDTLTFRVKAVDPQGSPLSFSWSASEGTLAAPANTADTSEVQWTVSACAATSTSPTLTVTVSNALGLTVSTSFSITSNRAACSTAATCKALLASNPATPSGIYTLDPDGPGPIAPFESWCDMETEGGGWTLVAVRDNLTSTALVESLQGTSAHGVALTDPKWLALRDGATQMLLKDGGAALLARANIARMKTANCAPLVSTLSALRLAHSEQWGCAVTGLDYCLVGDYEVRQQAGYFHYCSGSLDFFEVVYGPQANVPAVSQIFVR